MGNHIMPKSIYLKTIQEILEKARKRTNDAQYEGETGGDDAEGSYSDPTDEVDDSDEYGGLNSASEDDDKNDAADQWLQQQQSKGSRFNEEDGSKNEEDVGENDDEMQQNVPMQADAGAKSKSQAKSKEKIGPDIDPDRLGALKKVTGHWLQHAEQLKNMRSDARVNPVLFGEGHRAAAHNSVHEDFVSAHRALTNSPDFTKLTGVQKMRAEVAFKKDWMNKNPDHNLNAGAAVAGAHQMHGKALDLHNKEMNARKAHILAGGQGTSSEGAMSSQEAAQHVGAGKDEDGGYQSSVVSDPAAVFASRFKNQLAGTKAPKTSESEENESLASPEMKLARHPLLDHPDNKKLINDFVSDYHPLIMRNANRARKKAMDMGLTDEKIDMGDLQSAGLHGLMQAAHDYHPESGSTFKAHANGKIGGLMQSHFASMDYVPKDMRAEMKSKEKGSIGEGASLATKQPESVSEQMVHGQPMQVQRFAPQKASSAPAPAPATPVKDLIANSGHADAANMADRHSRIAAQTVIRRKGGA